MVTTAARNQAHGQAPEARNQPHGRPRRAHPAPPTHAATTLTVMSIAGLLLLPGAGGGRDDKTLLAVQRRLDPLPVARCEFANRAAGRKGPERPDRAIAQVGELTRAFADELGVPTTSLAIGGRSFGGRMASMAVAEGLAVGGLVLLSYPLHPPGRPDTLRVEHLPQISVPTLVISGERDPFGRPRGIAGPPGGHHR